MNKSKLPSPPMNGCSCNIKPRSSGYVNALNPVPKFLGLKKMFYECAVDKPEHHLSRQVMHPLRYIICLTPGFKMADCRPLTKPDGDNELGGRVVSPCTRGQRRAIFFSQSGRR